MRNLIIFCLLISTLIPFAAAATTSTSPRKISQTGVLDCASKYSNAVDLVGKSDASTYHYFGRAVFSVVEDNKGNPLLSFDTLDLTSVFLDPDNSCNCFGAVDDKVKTYGYTGGQCKFGIEKLSILIGDALPENYYSSGFTTDPTKNGWTSINPVTLEIFGWGDCAKDQCSNVKTPTIAIKDYLPEYTPCTAIGIMISASGYACDGTYVSNIWGSYITVDSDSGLFGTHKSSSITGNLQAAPKTSPFVDSGTQLILGGNILDCYKCNSGVTGNSGPVTGAIFTSTPEGNIVNGNVKYPRKLDVWLNGGPAVANKASNCPTKGGGKVAAGLGPAGDYYFQVTDPPGKTLLSNDEELFANFATWKDTLHVHRRVTVSNDGYIAGYTGGHWNSNWGIGAGDSPTCSLPAGVSLRSNPYNPESYPQFTGCNWQSFYGKTYKHPQSSSSAPYNYVCLDRIGVSLYPFRDTPNNGGEYKAWMTPVAYYDSSAKSSSGFSTWGFIHAFSKTDNFKVTKQVVTTTAAPTTTPTTTPTTATTSTTTPTTATTPTTTPTTATTPTTTPTTTTTATPATTAPTTVTTAPPTTTTTTTTPKYRPSECTCSFESSRLCVGDCASSTSVRAVGGNGIGGGNGRADLTLDYSIVEDKNGNQAGHLDIWPGRNNNNNGNPFCFGGVMFYAHLTAAPNFNSDGSPDTASDPSHWVEVVPAGTSQCQGKVSLDFLLPSDVSPCGTYLFAVAVQIINDPTIPVGNGNTWVWAYRIGSRTRGDSRAPGVYDVFCKELSSSDACDINSFTLSGGNGNVKAYVSASQQDPQTRLISVSVPRASTVSVSIVGDRDNQGTVTATGSHVQIKTVAPCTSTVKLAISGAGASATVDYPICCISDSFVSPSCGCPVNLSPIFSDSKAIGSVRLFVTNGVSNDFDLAAQVTFASGYAIAEIRTYLSPSEASNPRIPASDSNFVSDWVVSPANGAYLTYDAGSIIRVASLPQVFNPWDNRGFCRESDIVQRFSWQSSSGTGVAYLQPPSKAPLTSNTETGWYGRFCQTSSRSLSSVFSSSVEVARITGITCDTDFAAIKERIATILGISSQEITELAASVDEETAEFFVTYAFKQLPASQAVSALKGVTDACLSDVDATITSVSKDALQSAPSSALKSSLFVIFAFFLTVLFF